MEYIYLNNTRGFSNAYIPIRGCTFLVGENSTGKSSFLSIIKTLSRPDFLFSTEFHFGDEDSVVGFADIVSACSTDKRYFEIGIINFSSNRSGKVDFSFSALRFVDLKGAPRLERCAMRDELSETRFIFGPRSTCYLQIQHAALPSSEEEALNLFKEAISGLDSGEGYEKFPRDIAPNPPLGIALALARNLLRGSLDEERTVKLPFSIGKQLTWIAPIRTKPQRIYQGLHRDYSAEGEHSPFVLKQQLKTERFAASLQDFGRASGLFETVSTHTFGKGNRNPFEVLIKLKGAELNVENVGYGVSQALPLVVEFLSSQHQRRFAVQQPEVHLHPRAQAALGSLIFQVMRERKHNFLIETHSDFLIDRFRLELASSKFQPSAQVLFFSRNENGNLVSSIEIEKSGRYSLEQPSEFREFFIREEMRLLSI